MIQLPAYHHDVPGKRRENAFQLPTALDLPVFKAGHGKQQVGDPVVWPLRNLRAQILQKFSGKPQCPAVAGEIKYRVLQINHLSMPEYVALAWLVLDFFEAVCIIIDKR
jgi:hypothetical protein